MILGHSKKWGGGDFRTSGNCPALPTARCFIVFAVVAFAVTTAVAGQKENPKTGKLSWKPDLTIWAASEKSSNGKSNGNEKASSGRDVNLNLGPTLQPGRILVFKAATTRGCFQKGPDLSWYCVDTVEWPKSVSDLFSVRSELYRGTKAVVRFEKGRLTRVFVVFPQKNFSKISDYFIKHWGQPSKSLERPLALFGLPDTTNKNLLWLAPGNEKKSTIVELRQFDDLSGMMPDTRTSVLEIHEKDSLPMFEYAERSDFILRTVRLGGAGKGRR